MKKLIYILLLGCMGAWAQVDLNGIRLTRDLRSNPDYVSYAEWIAQHPETGTLSGGPTVLHSSPSSLLQADKGLIALVVAQNVQSKLTSDLNRFVADLEARDYRVEMSTYSTSGTAEDLRDYLAGLYTDGLIGAVLVGSLPAAWYQMNDDWNGNGQFDPEEDWYEEFPSDLFLSDLDGVWEDDSIPEGVGPLSKGSDGIYDSHSGNRTAEIWVSRIDASQVMLQDQVTLYHNFFDRVHEYRQGELLLPSKGIFFIDQDWSQGFTEEEMDKVCEEYEEIRDTMITDADYYQEQIKEEGLYVTVCVHSSPEAHYFHKANSTDYDILYGWKINYIQPKYGFYNLFACSNCRWVEQNCVGVIYSFSGNGLASLGTSKTGSMLFFSQFNLPLAGGMSWGDAFKEWTNFWISNYGSSSAHKSWFMGMCLLGDATLDLKEQLPIAVAEQESNAQALIMNMEPVIHGETTIRLSLPHTEQVNLSIFDASGRLATNLYDKVLEAGEHSFVWNPENAAAGVYFVRVVTPTSTQAGQKIVLTR